MPLVALDPKTLQLRSRFTASIFQDPIRPESSALGVYIHDSGPIRISSKFPDQRFPRDAIREVLDKVVDTVFDLVMPGRGERSADFVSASDTNGRGMNEFVLLDAAAIAPHSEAPWRTTERDACSTCRSLPLRLECKR
jgi:hypothetical protein